MSWVIFFVLLEMFQLSVGHEAFRGSCPKVQPMKDFDMEQFQGKWYIIDIFEKGVRCMTWNISQESDKAWKVQESRQSGILHSVGLDSKSVTTASLTPKGLSGSYVVSWPLNIAGSYDFTVIHTDYEIFAGIFACQELFIGHRQQALVLSRTPFLKRQYRQITKGKLQKFKVDPYYYHKVDQTQCGYDDSDEIPTRNYGPLERASFDEDEDEYEEEGEDDAVIDRRWFGDYAY